LRQEFRELELLNEITELRYSNKLPASAKGINRHELLRSFQLVKGGNYQPEEMSEHIRWKKRDEPLLPTVKLQYKWTLVGKDIPKETKPKKTKTGTKRKGAPEGASTKPPKKLKVVETGPVWIMWDSVNHSCSYDTMFTAIYDIW
ncbi:hypothetical protein B0H10DRAFT_1674013, partial [Mycena sp. CBHHK59/15]